MIRVEANQLRNLQTILDVCAPGTIIQCSSEDGVVEVAKTLVIRKPLTLRGLRARLPDGKGNTSLVQVTAAGVTVSDFELIGNSKTVPQSKRQSLLVIQAGDFHVENGVFRDSTRNGVSVELPLNAPKNSRLVGGVISNVAGYNCARDIVSIGGNSNEDDAARSDCAIVHVVIDDVRCFKDVLAGKEDGRIDSRGAVEVSDGTENITVKRVTAENSEYAVDLQTHDSGQRNVNIVIEGPIVARNCLRAVGTRTMPGKCSKVVIQNVFAEKCVCVIDVRQNIDGLEISNVTATAQDLKANASSVAVAKCNGLSITNVVLKHCSLAKGRAAVQLVDCNSAIVDGVSSDTSSRYYNSVLYQIGGKNDCKNVQISRVDAPNAYWSGILLERDFDAKGTLQSYTISNNKCTVIDRIKGKNGKVVSVLGRIIF